MCLANLIHTLSILDSPAATSLNRPQMAAKEGHNNDISGTAADDLCERCHGTKLVTLHDTWMGDADDQPCPECAP